MARPTSVGAALGEAWKTQETVEAATALVDFRFDRGEYDNAIVEYYKGLEADPLIRYCEKGCTVLRRHQWTS